MPRFVVATVLLLMLGTGLAWGIDPYITEPVPALAASELPKAFSNAVDPSGIRLISTALNQRISVCDVWWSKQVLTQKSATKAADVLYPNLKPGTFLGVISLFHNHEDFQHHVLRPGLYTMRYAQLDQDVDEHAVSPYRDFVVLSPAWVDKDPAATVPLDQLTKWSLLASHRDEPAALSLVPVNPAYKTFPWPVADDRGYCTLQLEIRAEGKSLQLAIIVVRPMWENEGS